MAFPTTSFIKYTTGVFISAATSTGGSTFVAFPSTVCNALQVDNTSPDATSIQVQRGTSGGTICIPAGGTRYFSGITDANQLRICRSDASTTQVTVSAEAITQ